MLGTKKQRAMLWLSMVVTPGDPRADEMVEHSGPVATARVWAHTLRGHRVPTPTDIDRVIHRLTTDGIQMIDREHPTWPKGLADLGPHAPLALFIRGDRELLHAPRLTAVVGTRTPTRIGIESARALCDYLVAHEHTLVSGGALGIDAIAHRSALRMGRPTLAVVATGLDRSYPREHTRLFDSIAHCGAVVSERPPGAAVGPWSFLARNRIIAALSHQSVVVECPARSGALSTASHAASLGRDLFAVTYRAHRPENAGSARLIDEWNATPIGPFDSAPDTIDERVWPALGQAI
jgi:DNA processing protein